METQLPSIHIFMLKYSITSKRMARSSTTVFLQPSLAHQTLGLPLARDLWNHIQSTYSNIGISSYIFHCCEKIHEVLYRQEVLENASSNSSSGEGSCLHNTMEDGLVVRRTSMVKWEGEEGLVLL